MAARRPFLRYVATYVVVLLIPIVFLVLVFRVNVLTQIRSEAEARLALEADAAIDRLANELRQIANISYQVGQSPDFISFRIADPLTAIDAQETLFVANFTNDLIEELAYFPRNAEVVYASNSPYARAAAVSLAADAQRGTVRVLPGSGPSHRGPHEGSARLLALCHATRLRDREHSFVAERERPTQGAR